MLYLMHGVTAGAEDREPAPVAQVIEPADPGRDGWSRCVKSAPSRPPRRRRTTRCLKKNDHRLADKK